MSGAGNRAGNCSVKDLYTRTELKKKKRRKEKVNTIDKMFSLPICHCFLFEIWQNHSVATLDVESEVVSVIPFGIMKLNDKQYWICTKGLVLQRNQQFMTGALIV